MASRMSRSVISTCLGHEQPTSQYSGVLSKFILAFLQDQEPVVYGDGLQSRDFTYIANVVDVTLRACHAGGASGRVFNGGTGARIQLNEVLKLLQKIAGKSLSAQYQPPRNGDIRDSQADVSSAREVLGYIPSVGFEEGLIRTWEWYRDNYGLSNQ